MIRSAAKKISQKLKLEKIVQTHRIVEINQNHLNHLIERVAATERNSNKAQDSIRLALGRNELRLLTLMDVNDINFNEFQVFSQWGEDGIIQFLLRKMPSTPKRFIEFGVEDYVESNTRFLLINNNWSGLVFDGSKENINKITNSDLYWRHDLTAKKAFITRENINDLIKESGFSGEIGILSIDIDGNDYWVWDAINNVDAAIVVIEYNHRFGPTELKTVPYDPKFERSTAHYSMLYAGASVALLAKLADKKGYDLVGTGSNGNNAFFVKKSLRPNELKKKTPQEAYHQGKFREARNKKGLLSYISLDEELKLLEHLPTINPLNSSLRKKGNKL